MILIQEKVTFDGDGGFHGVMWIDRTTVQDEGEAKEWIEGDDKQREGYRLLPLAEDLPVREVAVKVVPTVRFVPQSHDFKFGIHRPEAGGDPSSDQ